ncbi:NAD-dependent epimerase [Halalkalibacterium halodurans]|uniref:Nucleotide sugar epimerase (Biosynthesis of lipopolysaccharide O antigen) n=1 Tax=Halalkalibacterium halodurans (strain ATCC BAA-125 / DSM 18197 / FERM 7344 / JCM 9153 / C-125) TaxID=272558 RepID=Q9K6M0_HALH5|nr:NAD-dependent epimerase [Halalkalibacterium halodurans]MED4170871.1 NAD-dependent epimerase [Halalkalibacterium halodurans]BAB07428.1 nucleotide sugar epimerase (biosynthesis of lipopolysaccharide O antigen) [Halalkalibacterium halodurans C-125]
MKILVTGAAGFIGMYVAKRLLEEGHFVVGIDNLNDYYDPQLKNDRLLQLRELGNFEFHKMDLTERDRLRQLFLDKEITHVINLAAQAGVRYSLKNPHAYIDSNLVGFTNLLESCRELNVKHLIYASSSSVYGANRKMPFATSDEVNHPVSLYAATKKANELLAHSYSHLYHIPTTGLRFFTVYGPWGRPDMAYFSFTKNIVEGQTIKVFNHGEMMRDFTYIDDIVDGVVALLEQPPQADPNWDFEHPMASSSYAPYKIYNIGNNQPVKLMDFIETLEKHLGIEAKKEFLPMQPGDVQATYADIDDLQQATGFTPSTSIDEGLKKFVDWFKTYYNVEAGVLIQK